MTTRTEALARLTVEMDRILLGLRSRQLDAHTQTVLALDCGLDTADGGVIWKHTIGGVAVLTGWIGNDHDYGMRHTIEVDVYGDDDEVLPEECSICSGGHSTEWHAGQVA
jgi:hypothetical protein